MSKDRTGVWSGPITQVELLAALRIEERLTFDETCEALQRLGAVLPDSTWRNLSGNEIYALANVAVATYLSKRGG